MCVMSLLLRCGALTCSHHKQQSHHQSKEQVHLHFAIESCVMWQVPHSVSLCQCEVGGPHEGFIYEQEAHPYLAMLCTWGWSQNLLPIGGVPLSPYAVSLESVFMRTDGLVC